jgi:AcrR family transcriptional regulator
MQVISVVKTGVSKHLHRKGCDALGSSNARQRILDAALQLFSEKGYEGTTTREISERAGVNEVTIFRHFGSKEALFREGIQQFSVLSILTDELSSRMTGNLREDLLLFSRAYMEKTMEYRECIRIAMLEAPKNAELARLVSQIPVRIAGFLEDYFLRLHADGKLPRKNFGLLARMLNSLLFQYVYMKLQRMDDILRTTQEGWIEASVGLVVQGLTTPDP